MRFRIENYKQSDRSMNRYQYVDGYWKRNQGVEFAAHCFHMQNKTIVEHYDEAEDSFCSADFDKNGWYGIAMSWNLLVNRFEGDGICKFTKSFSKTMKMSIY